MLQSEAHTNSLMLKAINELMSDASGVETAIRLLRAWHSCEQEYSLSQIDTDLYHSHKHIVLTRANYHAFGLGRDRRLGRLGEIKGMNAGQRLDYILREVQRRDQED